MSERAQSPDGTTPSLDQTTTSEDQTTSLAHYLAPLQQYRTVVVLVTLVVAALGLLVAAAGPRSYTATTSVLIYPVSADPTEALQASDRYEDMATELRIASSRAVAEMAATELGELGINVSPQTAAANTSVTNPEDSRVLNVAYQSSDPAIARVGSELATSAYLAYRSELNAASRQVARGAINDEISVLQDRLTDVEDRLDQTAAGSSARLVVEIEKTSIEGELQAQQRALADLSTLSIDAATVFDTAREPNSADGLSVAQLLIGSLAGGLVLGVIAAWTLAAMGIELSPQRLTRLEKPSRSFRRPEGDDETEDADSPFDDSDTRDPLQLLQELEAVESDPRIALAAASAKRKEAEDVESADEPAAAENSEPSFADIYPNDFFDGDDGGTPPAEQLEAPADQFEAPAEQLEAPADQFEAPAQHLEAPGEQLEAPGEQLEAPAIDIEVADRIEAEAEVVDEVPEVQVAVEPDQQGAGFGTGAQPLAEFDASAAIVSDTATNTATDEDIDGNTVEHEIDRNTVEHEIDRNTVEHEIDGGSELASQAHDAVIAEGASVPDAPEADGLPGDEASRPSTPLRGLASLDAISTLDQLPTLTTPTGDAPAVAVDSDGADQPASDLLPRLAAIADGLAAHAEADAEQLVTGELPTDVSSDVTAGATADLVTEVTAGATADLVADDTAGNGLVLDAEQPLANPFEAAYDAADVGLEYEPVEPGTDDGREIDGQNEGSDATAADASLSSGDPNELDPGPPSWEGPFVGPTTWEQLSAMAAAAEESNAPLPETSDETADVTSNETAGNAEGGATFDAEVAAEVEQSARPDLVSGNDIDTLFEQLGSLGSAGPVAVLSLSDRNPAAGLTAGFELADELRAVGAHVLLVDARIDQPVLDTLFEEPGAGLAQVMTGQVVLDQAVRTLSGLDGLDLLTVGAVTSETAGHLTGAAFHRLLSEARLNYHSIVIIGDAITAAGPDDAIDVERSRALAATVDGLIVGTYEPVGTTASPELAALLASFDAPTLQLITAPVAQANDAAPEASSV